MKLQSMPSRSGRVQKLASRKQCLKNSPCLRNTNLSLSKTFKFSVKMAKLSPQRNYKSRQQNGITTTCNIQEQHVKKRLCLLHRTGKAYNILSMPTSKSAINAKSTRDVSNNMVNYIQSQWFQNPGRLSVLTLLDHALSKVRMAVKLTLCVSQ